MSEILFRGEENVLKLDKADGCQTEYNKKNTEFTLYKSEFYSV